MILMKNSEYPNQTIKLLMERASCRSFSDKKIPPDVLRLILEAGTHAPTGENFQPYSIIKIEDDETKQRLVELDGQPFIGKAPVLLLFCIDWHRTQRWVDLEVAPLTFTSSFHHFWESVEDTIICAQNICTAADSMGLGSCYDGRVLWYLRELRDMFQLPQGVFPSVLLCLGYPKAKPPVREKLGVEVIVHSERYCEREDQEIIDAFSKKYRGRKPGITEERLERIAKVCCEAHGEAFARKCVATIRESGFINTAQWLFCLQFPANDIPIGNDTYLQLMEEFGFNWFKGHRPFEDKAT
jgi:FMN reductase [NAD(P)H]